MRNAIGGQAEVEGRDGGNSRNGYRMKTLTTDIGQVEVAVPRDRVPLWLSLVPTRTPASTLLPASDSGTRPIGDESSTCGGP